MVGEIWFSCSQKGFAEIGVHLEKWKQLTRCSIVCIYEKDSKEKK